MKTVFPFTTPEMPSLEQAGGKAVALMQMTTAGMPVPPGLVLTARFFEPWLEGMKLLPAWKDLSTRENLAQSAKKLQQFCGTLELTKNQRSELDSALKTIEVLADRHFFAVRSSSPEEDLEGASFAGGYETILGVEHKAIEAAIRHSFTSAFDERVFLYKQKHGFPIDKPRIAVIIQRQVAADAAGVAFSINPLNNCYDEAVINANHGLGESVVSGDADPDMYIVDKVRDEVLETHVGAKQTVINLSRTGGTVKSARDRQNETAITNNQALELARMVVDVETYYHKPVDIEWAISDGRIALLQSRPITTYLPLPPEMVTEPGQPKRLYANSTLIEQGLQKPLSVLGTDFLSHVLEKVGGPVAEGAIGMDGITFTAGGGYYMNVSHALMMGMKNNVLAPGSFGDPRVMEILDSIDMHVYLEGELPKQLKSMRGRMILRVAPMAVSVIKAFLFYEQILSRYQAALPEQNSDLETLSVEAGSLRQKAIALAGRLTFFYGDFGIPMILAAQIAQRRIRNLYKADGKEVQDHLTNLGVSLPGNKTTEMGQLMYALAASSEFRQFDKAADFLAALACKSVSSDLSRRWDELLAEFGDRCPGEIDPATPRPGEHPALLFEQLKSIAVDDSRSFFDQARDKRQTAYRELHRIALQKGKRTARILERMYARWITLGGYRETPKHYAVRAIALFRRIVLVKAETLVATGRLDRPDQIFNLTIADIDRAGTEPSLDLRALAHERSELIRKIDRCKVTARIIDSRGRIYYPPRKATSAGELNGIPISPGIVQGPAKVLHHATEKPLLRGEILIARATDPGWTPLFLNAKGIILEIGGALQHGAIVAREYGIPCVSGLDEATERLTDGMMVEVDGSNGIVRVLDYDRYANKSP